MVPCVCCQAGFPAAYCEAGHDKGCYEFLANNKSTGEIDLFDIKAEEPQEEKTLTDPVSAGRKRAARLYKIEPGQICDWAYMKNCGGGPVRITGCSGKPAQAIHHGPDKSTLNNDRSNVSIICDHCHNRFHTANDRYYMEPRPGDNGTWLPTLQSEDKPVGLLSEMVPASKEEVLVQEMTTPLTRAEKRRINDSKADSGTMLSN